MDRKGKTEGVRRLWDKYKFVGLVVLVGAVLLMWPGGSESSQKERKTPDVERESVSDMEQKMAEILSNISGVGQVRVMLTLDSDGERQLAQNAKLSYRGDTHSPEDYSRSSETVLLDGADGDQALVTRRTYPTYRGALVVCQGGGRPEVQLAVTQAVAALTGLSADRVTVAKWQ